jgi:hypothetical protein
MDAEERYFMAPAASRENPKNDTVPPRYQRHQASAVAKATRWVRQGSRGQQKPFPAPQNRTLSPPWRWTALGHFRTHAAQQDAYRDRLATIADHSPE